MAKNDLILLSRQPMLYKTLAGWQPPGAEIYAFEDAAAAVSRAAAGAAAVVIFDARSFPAARSVLSRLVSLRGDTDVVVLGPSNELLGEGLQPELGTVRFLPADVPVPELKAVVELLLRMRLVRQDSGIVGRSRAVGQMIALIAQAAPHDISILITGESGTGKELVARAVHRHSARRDGPFLSLNCGAMTEGVLESELFGHTRGAFTGAVAAHDGVFQRANRGTLFLDEVGEMPLGMQTRFLRALETGEYTPVGGKAIQRSDIRLVAATNRDLTRDIESGRFRQDLYYRLRVIVIDTPPLRERQEDVLVLADHFLQQENRARGLAVRGFSRHAKQVLREHPWPGNIRELLNVVRAAVVMKQRGLIEMEDLPPDLGPRAAAPSPYLPVVLPVGQTDRLDPGLLASALLELRQDIKQIRSELRDLLAFLRPKESTGRRISADGRIIDSWHGEARDDSSIEGGDLQSAEKALIAAALAATGSNRRRAAARLGISERTLYRKLKHYDLA